jgi:hypothetical protein
MGASKDRGILGYASGGRKAVTPDGTGEERLLIEEANYGTAGPEGYPFLARSPGLVDDWLPTPQPI